MDRPYQDVYEIPVKLIINSKEGQMSVEAPFSVFFRAVPCAETLPFRAVEVVLGRVLFSICPFWSSEDGSSGTGVY